MNGNMEPNRDSNESSPSSIAEASSHFAELSADLQARIDDLCDRFEAECQSGDLPTLEAFLSECSGADRVAVLRELVPLDVAYRQQRGESPTMEDYQRRFPELAESWLEDLFDAQTEVGISAAQTDAVSKPVSTVEIPSVDEFCRLIVESGLLTAAEVETQRATTSSESQTDAMSFARWLVERNVLTKFQAQMLLRRKPKGLVLGDCVVLNLLGRGGMGAVYRALHRRMDRIVAIKVLPPSAARDRQLADRFRREVKAAAKLSHRNIVAAYDAGEQHGILYLVMEFVEGQDLASLVRTQGAMSVAQAVEVLAQAAEGLAFAHEQGVLHRDIKPHNLMLESRTGGTVKVLDMGLARLVTDAPVGSDAATGITRSGMLIGTAEYMAPEQAINVKQVDQRADIYALGATLHFLLLARHMYSGASFLEIVMAHQMMPVPSLRTGRADIPQELDQLFQRMVAKRPEDRPRSMLGVAAELRTLQERGLPTGTPELRVVPNRAERDQAVITEEFSTAEYERVDDGIAFEATSSVIEDASEESVALEENQSPSSRRSNSRRTSLSTLRRAKVAIVAVACLLIVFASIKRAFRVDPDVVGGGSSSARPELAIVPFSNARERQLEWAKYLKTEDSLSNSIGMQLRLIPPGEFPMGLSDSEFAELRTLPEAVAGRDRFEAERPQHRVRITRPFWMGRSEVTVGQFRQFIDATGYKTDAETSETGGWGLENNQWRQRPGYCWKNLGEHPLPDDLPAVSVSHNDCIAFCEWLSKHERVTYRLPTEAEWEFASRAGIQSTWPRPQQNASVDEIAWFLGNSAGRIHPVETRSAPNDFGLFDMFGNESEWCLDWYDATYYRRSPIDDPRGPETGEFRIQRGGMFGFNRYQLRFSVRDSQPPNAPTHGAFRIVREIP